MSRILKRKLGSKPAQGGAMSAAGFVIMHTAPHPAGWWSGLVMVIVGLLFNGWFSEDTSQ